MFDNLWVEKYRPATLEGVQLTTKNRAVFEKFEKDKEIPNLLFVGSAGIGKTSLAKVICKSMLGCQYLYINASDENGIDTIRSKVNGFAQIRSFDGGIKCIILDEVDGLTLDAQRALRNTMEEYAQLTRFILTANYNHRVIPPLQSRCQSFDLTPTVEMCIDRVLLILSKEKVNVTTEAIEKITKFIKTCHPDLRKCINEIQKSVIDGDLVLDNLSAIKNTFVEGIYKIVDQGYAIKARKKVIENEHVFNGDYTELLRSMFNYVHDSKMPDEKKSQQLIVISEHMYRASFVVDPEINFYSCLLSMK